MRTVVNIVGGLAALLTAGAVGFRTWERGRQELAVKDAAEAVERFEQQVRLRAATAGEGLNARGWPATVDPTWFGDNPPMNPLVSPGRPWVEVAPPEHAMLSHPQVRGAVDASLAAFWYNPYLGVIRARVPMRVSDRETVALYNRVNSARVSEVIDTTPVPPPPAISAEPGAGDGEPPPPDAPGASADASERP